MNTPRILRVDKSGHPMEWLFPHEAATLICNDRVVWSTGMPIMELRGGKNATGNQSRLSLPAIVATTGCDKSHADIPPLTNRMLFRRDGCICMYCGKQFVFEMLSRDHIMPASRGGRDEWGNVITSCKRCNSFKSNRTPEEAGMALLAIPFVPSRHEYLYLANRHILADQMDFLKAGFGTQILQRIQ
ncbi:restriction endonuclease [Oleiphilus messinensis]|uniref:Restriction endonuclease n=1 Tax=Oleiphilus messinensis TaxID=141451 RepID=A0A1Y0I7N3_9GAMM|nr:HNH endonuclease [Oleiphilus messinensis]ARU55454.1 restriction endonuclease [Oleiphilus messinensis]